ncbi:peptidase MA family metallohydrolase [Embleya sp. NPDC020886]|uniref:peptidase MA family metallohydrolase n=1 Tax=Embleya sp. NPDC020886 TaxID=3363980 RepID=UPI0037A73C7A
MHPYDPYGVWPHAVEPRRSRPWAICVALLGGLLSFSFVLGALSTGGRFVRLDSAERLLGHDGSTSDPAADHAAPGTPAAPGPGDATAYSDRIGNRAYARLAALVTNRSAAFERGDEAAFLARVDRQDPTLFDGQRRLFTNLRKVPFDTARWRPIGAGRTVTADGSSPDRAGTAAAWPVTVSANVAFEHAITGVDLSPVPETYVWKARCTGPDDPCTLVDLAGAGDADTETGFAGYPAAWDLWDLRVERRPHVLLMAPGPDAAALRRSADLAEQAAVYTLGAWKGGAGTSPGFALVLTSSRASFGRLYSSDDVQEWAAGYALAMPGTDRPVGGVRMVVDDDQLAGDAAFAPLLLRHEMTHALVAPLARSGRDAELPTWLAEGFADWQAEADRPLAPVVTHNIRALIDRGGFTGTPPAEEDFETSDEDRVENAYNLAHLMVRYLARTFGAERVCAFYTDVVTGRHVSVDEALTATFGVAPDRLRSDWAAWIRKTV